MSRQAEKMRAWRERRRGQGKQAVTVWLSREAVGRLNSLASEGKVTAGEVIERMITDAPPQVTDTIARDRDTITVIKALVREEVERVLPQITAIVTDAVTDTGKSVGTLPKVTDTLPKVSDNVTVTNKPTAETLARDAQALHAQGLSYEQIAKRWAQEGKPTLKGGRWHKGTIGKVVQRHAGQ